MRTTPVGLVMLNDEREHVYEQNNEKNREVLEDWAEIIETRMVNQDGTAPEIVTGSEIITGTRSAQRVGEELSRRNVKQVVMCYNVWNFPFLVWPFLNSLGKEVPVLSLS
ncbi:MAG: hypothetical protein ABEI54_04705, partial [Candidatus Bipolaricaulia bacterium]